MKRGQSGAAVTLHSFMGGSAIMAKGLYPVSGIREETQYRALQEKLRAFPDLRLETTDKDFDAYSRILGIKLHRPAKK
jgi:hypothetical protein